MLALPARSIDAGVAVTVALLVRADALAVWCNVVQCHVHVAHSATLSWGGQRFKCWSARCCAQTCPFLLRTPGATATIRSAPASLLPLASLSPPSFLILLLSFLSPLLPCYSCAPVSAAPCMCSNVEMQLPREASMCEDKMRIELRQRAAPHRASCTLLTLFAHVPCRSCFRLCRPSSRAHRRRLRPQLPRRPRPCACPRCCCCASRSATTCTPLFTCPSCT